MSMAAHCMVGGLGKETRAGSCAFGCGCVKVRLDTSWVFPHGAMPRLDSDVGCVEEEE